MMKLPLIAVLMWCCAACVSADECPFPDEREWISKLGDVVKGSFQSCTGVKLAVKTGRKRVEIPLNRLDEEDAALVRFLATPEARKDFKLAEMLWPFIMKELEKVTWTPVEKDISPRFDERARKAPAKSVSGVRKVDGLACASSFRLIKGPPFRILEYYRPQRRPASGNGSKNFDVALERGERYAYYDSGKGLLIPEKSYSGRRTAMRGPVSSLLPDGAAIAANEQKFYTNTDYSLIMERRPVKGGYETCKPGFLRRKKVDVYWNTEGKMACGVMKLEYDSASIAVLFNEEKKLMNAPGLGYAVILSRMSKKSRDSKVKDEHYYHVALAADGLPVYRHEGPEDEAAMDPLNSGKLRKSEKQAALAEERKREQTFRARQEARKRLVESTRKRNA